MSDFDALKTKLSDTRPEPWEHLPDIALYMDQLISYMPRQLMDLDGGEKLTSAMVNNYIKAGIVPRAEGKRYGKAHLAQLTEVCALKRVLSLGEMGTLLRALDEGDHPEALYENFNQKLDVALRDVAQEMAEPDVDPAQLALSLALQSYASQLACRRILEQISDKK